MNWDDLQDYQRVTIEPGRRLVRFDFRSVDENGRGLEDQDSYDLNLVLSGLSHVGYSDEDWYGGAVSVGPYRETIILYGKDIPDDWNKPVHHIELRISEYDLEKNLIRDDIWEVPVKDNNFIAIYETKILA